MASLFLQGNNSQTMDGFRFKLNSGVATSPNWYATNTNGTTHPGNFKYTVDGSDIGGLTNNIYGRTSSSGNSVEWIGYFLPNSSADYDFNVTLFVDSTTNATVKLWVGDNAISSFTNDNANINQLSSSVVKEFVYTFSAVGNVYYPVRLQYTRGITAPFGESYNISFSYKKSTDTTYITDWTNVAFFMNNGVMRF